MLTLACGPICNIKAYEAFLHIMCKMLPQLM
jgi:hypothetical protein